MIMMVYLGNVAGSGFMVHQMQNIKSIIHKSMKDLNIKHLLIQHLINKLSMKYHCCKRWRACPLWTESVDQLINVAQEDRPSSIDKHNWRVVVLKKHFYIILHLLKSTIMPTWIVLFLQFPPLKTPHFEKQITVLTSSVHPQLQDIGWRMGRCSWRPTGQCSAEHRAGPTTLSQ